MMSVNAFNRKAAAYAATAKEKSVKEFCDKLQRMFEERKLAGYDCNEIHNRLRGERRK